MVLLKADCYNYYIISLLGWRYLFFINIPLGILVLILVIKFDGVPGAEKKQKFDFFKKG